MSSGPMLAIPMAEPGVEREPAQSQVRQRRRQANGSTQNGKPPGGGTDTGRDGKVEKEHEHKHEHEDEDDRHSVITDIVDEVAATVENIAEQLTCVWDELQDWQRDNHFIIYGYRPATASYRKSLRSLSYWHNESINIYTHLLGAIFFTAGSYVLYAVLAPRYPTATRADIYAFLSFFIGCFVCLGLSATYHTVCNHSAVAARWWNVLDYVGIVGLIAGSFVGSVFYGFRCETAVRDAYWVMMCTIGVACATISIHPHFRTPKYRTMRTSMFSAMGLSGFLPIVHGMQLYGVAEASRRCGLPWLLAEGVSYIIGAAMYAARVPERWRPGTFDIVGASHQIFHVLVLGGAVLHLASLVAAFDYLHAGGEGAVC
ncbi:hypothetical protein Dda_8574 [Drechslerella dactyloides]|uniref:HlyIII-domain-containing protein n=1 Tax=Drechslerella dactyloides TaxID=74499 RepID=A0AAD6IQW4_DREDA|nr:hypothetical protein Dda_8574 [Drechslerella dactyloides]